MEEEILQQFTEARNTVDLFIRDPENIRLTGAAAQLLSEAFRNGNKVLSCGNGGSMCDAMHFAEELSGRFRNDRPALPAQSISDPSHISCVANDYGYDFVFSRAVEAFGRPGDVLLAISTSGNSKNVCLAAHKAKEKGMRVIALTGKNGGELAAIADVEIRAPFSEYADRAQEIHIKVIHTLIFCVERSLGYH
ncbi:MAG: D-sedoheptulose 7-phosphate isomerase [Bacteroidia bacterium]|nr:D-sedoheptulose 7-phosphate isomerase [Bacteroidia bacterium]